MSLDLLRTFLAVHRSGSVTRAAEHLGLSQPAVTAQVRALERALGQPLFERLPRGMAPTPAADELAGRVAAPLDALEELDVTETPERAVHLGGPAELMSVLALPALAPMVAGGLRLRVTLGLADDLLTTLAGGTLDLVVSTVRPRRGTALTAEALCDEEFVLVGAPGWDLDRLEAAPLVAYAENLPILRRYWRVVFGTRLTRVPALVVPDLRGVLAAVVAGAGVTVLPRYLCTAELTGGLLVPLLEPELPPINTLFLVSRAGRLHPMAVAVRDHLLRRGRSW
ncbi:LysR family transcriptional regulator [Streptosporangium sp. NPDC000239]|uniref:LysR family transcriptional regulator n=1 Tax=Streptosporangium sp. NPDC000239 TaxID=3154248 RepID=UPI003320EAA6